MMIRSSFQKMFLPAVGLFCVGMLSVGCRQSQDSVQEADTTGVADSADSQEVAFEPIFDGKTLEGWEGDTTYWSVEDGSLVGKVTPKTLLKANTFIIWRGGTTEDFELKADFRIAEAGNSGINYRSAEVPNVPHALRGYQADIDGRNNYTGQNYEERGRTTLAYRGESVTVRAQDNPSDPESFKAALKNNAWLKREVTGSLGSADSLKSLIKKNDWNTCHIIAKGNRLQHFINGVLMSDVTDADEENRKLTGLLGVQVHVGPPMKVEYRNIQLKKLKPS